MDFAGIINKSLAEVNEDFGDNARFQFKVDPPSENKCVIPHKMLQSYSENLLKNYHSELQKLLQEQGIHI